MGVTVNRAFRRLFTKESGGQGWIARNPTQSIEKQRLSYSSCGQLCSSFGGRRKSGSILKVGLELRFDQVVQSPKNAPSTS